MIFEKDIQFIKDHTEGHLDCFDFKSFGQMSYEEAVKFINTHSKSVVCDIKTIKMNTTVVSQKEKG